MLNPPFQSHVLHSSGPKRRYQAHSVDTFDAATSATGSAGSAAGSGGNVTSATGQNPVGLHV